MWIIQTDGVWYKASEAIVYTNAYESWRKISVFHLVCLWSSQIVIYSFWLISVHIVVFLVDLGIQMTAILCL